MLKKLYVDNYKCLVNFETAFDELSLLLGPNGVGKTSVLDVMFALHKLLSGTAKVTDPEVFPGRTLTRWQKRNKQVFEISLVLDDVGELSYRLEVEHEPSTRRARIALERLTADGKPLFELEHGEVQLYRDNFSQGPVFSADWSESALARVPPRDDNKKLSRFLEFARKIQVCGLYPRSFETESRTEDPLLLRDGSNFSAWYRHMFQERQDLVPEYTKALSEVIEGFKSIRLATVGEETRALMVVFEERGERYELRLDELSDGQRALLAIYALLHMTSGQGYSLFLDEPDNFIALAEIQPWLMALSDACGDTIGQVVICSHHPELIDYLGGDRGLQLKREASGATIAKKLTVNQDTAGLKLSEIVARGWER